mmetsp:Transcript_35099/g.91142  ORF Transcript_35099/g.91142 Transcript_35099/m.91142 type:complete len:182 (+) Transcript_35099:229-774(+)|eukprot:jgi/Tetstr1/457830/TSEL_044375.t1
MGKTKKGKKSAAVVANAEAVEEQPAQAWVCEECGQENDNSDALCCACEEPRPAIDADEGHYQGYLVGAVLSAKPVANKDKLQLLMVDVGRGEPLQIVSNASNVKEGMHVVVAPIGSKYTSGSGEEEEVAKGVVGGVTSYGMLCNGPMLGWKGGDNRAAATLPADEYKVGSKPPASRPRKAV